MRIPRRAAAVHLSSEQLRHLAAATRALLSPGEYAEVDEWRREVNRSVRALFRADHALFQLPGPGARYFSAEMDDAVLAGLERAAESTAHGMRYRDPELDRLYRARRQSGGEAFTLAGNERLLGVRMASTAVYAEVLLPAGVRDFCGAYAPAAGGDAMLWASFGRAGANPLGEGAREVLAVLAPALRAGVERLRHPPFPAPGEEELRARFGLTAREAEVLGRLASGDSNKRLASSLGVSAHTARHHTERVFAKLGVHSRRELLARLRDPARTAG